MANLRSLSVCVLAGAFILSTASNAQQATNARLSAPARITAPIDENQLVTLPGNVHPVATAKNDRGPVSAALPMNGLVLVLSRSPEKQAAFDAYVESEYDSGSPNFHQWLMPDAIGEQYGPSQADVATVTGWLAGHGFAVSQVSKDRLAITFSGTAGQVQSAFHTSIHNLSVNGKAHIANMSEPQIPAALAPVVVGVKQLHDFFPRPMHRVGSVVQFNQSAGKWQRAGSVPGLSTLHGLASFNGPNQSSLKLSPSSGLRPEFGQGGGTSSSSELDAEDVAPYDFATMYNVKPLWGQTPSINGANQTIAIVGTSDICLGQSAAPCSSTNDISQFRSTFGLPAGVAPILDAGVNGHDPGICTGTSNPCNGNDLLENSLDVEWSGAVATGAQIVLVTSGYTGTNDPISDDAQFIVDNHGSTSSTTSIKDIANASILSISYGNCELGVGTANNVAFYNLWEKAAAAGISVFIATGDSGAPACDEGGSSGDGNGNPYSAQFGLAVSGLASTPFNVAVGGTDFSWCKPVYDSGGNVQGCPATLGTAGPYWSTSANNTTAGGYESAVGYVPETPWNDSCMNPIWAAFVESLAPLTGIGTTPTNAEGACNYVQNNWQAINQEQVQASGNQFVLAGLIDTVGAGGGASNCVVNDIATDPNDPTCTANSTTTGAANGSIALTNDGWPKPSWQAGVTLNDGVRDLPDVSFFAGDGALDSSTLVCVALLQGASCSVTETSSLQESSALEVGGTSVATPEMAGVMALINQKAGAPQGLPNKELYALAGLQTSAKCSSETVKNNTAGCYFNDVDQGTIDMPCDNGASIGGAIFEPQTGAWEIVSAQTGDIGLNCAALNSGDTVGSLVTSGTNVGYNAGAGYDAATGLGSLNVANVVNAWSSNAGTATATVAAQLSASTIAANVALTVTATVSGSSTTPTGTVTVTGSGANASGTLTAGVATIVVPANTLAVGGDTLTITYGGDGTYASASTTAHVTVSQVAPTVDVVPGASAINSSSSLSVTVSIEVPAGSATPTGTVTLAGGGYTSSAVSLSGGAATFTIPANSFTAGGNVTLTASYSGDSNYTSATGSAVVAITVAGGASFGVAVPTAPTAVSSPGGSTTAAAKVTGSNGYAGTVTLSCALTQSPTGAVDSPTCAATSNSVTLSTTSTSGTVNFTIGTTAATSAQVDPASKSPKGWIGASGGAVLAFLVFLGVPSRRRSWRAMLGLVVLLASLGGLSACGGGSTSGGGGGGGNPGTTTGSYTFTVTSAGSPAITPEPTTTFTVTVN